MKNITAIILLLVIVSTNYAQNQKTSAVKPRNVLVIPFFPMMYIVDEEFKIAKQSNKKHEQILNYFRQSLDNEINKTLNDSVQSLSILSSTTGDSQDDLFKIFENIQHYYATPLSTKLDRKKSKFYLMPKDRTEYLKKESQRTISNGQIKSRVVNRDLQFMHVIFKDTNLLSNLSKKYDNDYFLFITQFEIRKNYSSPYSTTKKLKVHYSIYNAAGKFVFGSYVTNQIPSNENSMETITKDYFSLISKKIFNNSPFKTR